MSTTLPAQFGQYTLLKLLARGGMGEIYLARTAGMSNFEKYYAIKKLLRKFAHDRDVGARFIDEAKLGARLQHPNIVQVYDLGGVADELYMATEFVDGFDLRRVLRYCHEKKKRIPLDVALFVVREILSGLAYAHRQVDAEGNSIDLIHRDISPQNVLVSFEGEVKIIDFGLAKSTQRSQETQANVLLGNFGYMSPEQARGHKLDVRTDVYSAGIVLFELTTGTKRFVDDNPLRLLEMVARPTPIMPSDRAAEIPTAVNQIYAMATAPAREDRFSSAELFRDEVTAVLHRINPKAGREHLAQFLNHLFLGGEPPPPVDPDLLDKSVMIQVQELVASSVAFQKSKEEDTADRSLTAFADDAPQTGSNDMMRSARVGDSLSHEALLGLVETTSPVGDLHASELENVDAFVAASSVDDTFASSGEGEPEDLGEDAPVFTGEALEGSPAHSGSAQVFEPHDYHEAIGGSAPFATSSSAARPDDAADVPGFAPKTPPPLSGPMPSAPTDFAPLPTAPKESPSREAAPWAALEQPASGAERDAFAAIPVTGTRPLDSDLTSSAGPIADSTDGTNAGFEIPQSEEDVIEIAMSDEGSIVDGEPLSWHEGGVPEKDISGQPTSVYDASSFHSQDVNMTATGRAEVQEVSSLSSEEPELSFHAGFPPARDPEPLPTNGPIDGGWSTPQQTPEAPLAPPSASQVKFIATSAPLPDVEETETYQRSEPLVIGRPIRSDSGVVISTVRNERDYEPEPDEPTMVVNLGDDQPQSFGEGAMMESLIIDFDEGAGSDLFEPPPLPAFEDALIVDDGEFEAFQTPEGDEDDDDEDSRRTLPPDDERPSVGGAPVIRPAAQPLGRVSKARTRPMSPPPKKK